MNGRLLFPITTGSRILHDATLKRNDVLSVPNGKGDCHPYYLLAS